MFVPIFIDHENGSGIMRRCQGQKSLTLAFVGNSPSWKGECAANQAAFSGQLATIKAPISIATLIGAFLLSVYRDRMQKYRENCNRFADFKLKVAISLERRYSQ